MGTTEAPSSFSAFTPACLTDKVFWLDADDSNSLTISSGEVIEAQDLSGNDYDIAPPDSSNNPTISSTTQNGKTLIEFAEGDYFENNNVTIPSSGNLQAFIVCDVTGSDHVSDSILTMDSSNDDFQIDAGIAGTEFRGRINASGIGDSSTGVPSDEITGMHIWNASFDFDSSEYLLRLDGEQRSGSSVADYTNELATSMKLRIFANRGENQFPEGRIAEIIIYEDVTEGQRQKVEGYLAHKWGLTSLLDSSHPYKTTEAEGCFHQDPCVLSPFCHSFVDSNGATIVTQFDIEDPDQWDHRNINGTDYTQATWSSTNVSGAGTAILAVAFQSSESQLNRRYKWTLTRSNASDLEWYSAPGACPDSSPVICDCGDQCTTTTPEPTTSSSSTSSTSTSSTTQEPTTSSSTTSSSTSSSTTSSTSTSSTTPEPTTHYVTLDSFSSSDNGLWQMTGANTPYNNPNIDIADGDSIEFTNDTSQDFHVFPYQSSTAHGTCSAGSTETMTFTGTSNYGYSDEDDGDPYIQGYISPS
jgi:hypothetical protein